MILAVPPLSLMPLERLTPSMEDRAWEVQMLLADQGHHRAPSIPDLLIAATAEKVGLTGLAVALLTLSGVGVIAGNRFAMVLLPLWLNGLLLRALAWYGEVAWNIEALWHSRLIQTTFALVWTLAALAVMLRATRRHSRREWLCGAALLGVVIVKLMLVDSARGGGLARAVAFIGVAILVLIVGYFSPLPPKAGEEK